MRWWVHAFTVTVGLLALSAWGQEEPVGVPLKPDPPFAVDGDLDDWAKAPFAIRIDRPEQAVWSPAAWGGPSDLSGTVRLAWRPEQLYLAADVTDDQLCQTERGPGIWRGDHVELYLDMLPELEPERQQFGRGQFQFCFSPGNFLQTGDPLLDCRPEAYLYRPERGVVEGLQVASRQTERGWTIEVAIPWSALDVERPSEGMLLRYEIGLSDTDGPEPRQEAMLTTSSAPWGHTRGRLNPAVLAGSDGVARPPARRVAILDELRLEQGQSADRTFLAPDVPAGREAVIALSARLDHAKVAGHHPGLTVRLNGQALAGDRLVGKPLRVTSRGGRVYSMYAGDRLATYYAPDFTSADNDAFYGLADNVKACEFALRVTDLLRPGENTLTIVNSCGPQVTNPLVVGEVRLEFRVPPPPEREKAGPPTGPLPVCEPAAEQRTAYDLQQPASHRIEVSVGGETFVVESRFSIPKPAWVHGSNEFFDHARTIEQTPEAIVVRDTFTNRSGEDLMLQQRHEVALGNRLEALRLAGLVQPAKVGKLSEPANPTTFAATARAGLGLLPLSDVFRCHVTNYATGEVAGLADEQFILRAGTTYTAEWAIVPVASPGYWAFLNAARRLLDVNFTLEGAFAFLRADPRLVGKWSDDQVQTFIDYKDARYVCASIGWPYYQGHIPHGTAFQELDYSEYLKEFERRRRVAPNALNLIYFHCFIDVHDEAPEKYADSRLLRPDGTQADYGESFYRIFLPTETTSYGPAVARNVDIILDTIGADGVYWDEHEYSRYQYHYGEPWDGVSGDADPKTLGIARRKSSVTLLTEPWRLKLVDRIVGTGHALVGNGAPYTRAMLAKRFPCFVETGSITNCTLAQLYSPIALGDHLTERSETDAYRTMLAALDYGCVYHWYNDVTVVPTHHHLTRYMYPITPLELHEGYLIGAERIVTNRSGLYGWGDDSEHEVHVFDDRGVEVEGFAAPLVRRDGKTYTELRIGEGWSAAIVRKRG